MKKKNGEKRFDKRKCFNIKIIYIYFLSINLMLVDCEQSVLLKPLYFDVALEAKQQFVHLSTVTLALSMQPKTNQK